MKRLISVLALSILISGCATNNATKGAVTGGALGTGLGAIVGSATGNAGAGMAIGAAAGAVGGALIGNQFDNQEAETKRLEQRNQLTQQQLDENRRLIDQLKRSGADVRSSKRGVVVNLPDILFRFDRADLTPEAGRTINEVAKVLRDVKGRVIAVEGHTDSVGNTDYNRDLSARRADAVAKQLISDGVDRSAVRSKGFGEGSPIATNNTEAGRARNRRVEVIVEN